jgi:hypothetical protein
VIRHFIFNVSVLDKLRGADRAGGVSHPPVLRRIDKPEFRQ